MGKDTAAGESPQNPGPHVPNPALVPSEQIWYPLRAFRPLSAFRAGPLRAGHAPASEQGSMPISMPIVNWLRRLVRRDPGPRRIQQLTEKAAAASPRYRGSLYARAGDMTRELGEATRADALRLYGKSIDAYLEAGRGRAAELICERVIEAYPDVVRTRCTLALIAIGQRDMERARRRISDYVARVVPEESREPAIATLLQMASVTDEPEARQEIARGLETIERPELAERVLDQRAAFASGTSWSRAVSAALRRPDEVDVQGLSEASPEG